MNKFLSALKRSNQFRQRKKTIKKFLGGGIYIFDNSNVRIPTIMDFLNGKLFMFGLIKFSKKHRSIIQVKSGESKVVYCVDDLAICFYKTENGFVEFLNNKFIDKIPYPKVDLIEKHKNCIIYKRAIGKNPSTYDEIKMVCILVIECLLKEITFDVRKCLSVNHGDFSQKNVFITSDGHFQCIDYDNAGLYPLLNDVFIIILMPYIYHRKSTFVPILGDQELIDKYYQLRNKLNLKYTFAELFYNYFRYWQKNSEKGFYMFGKPYRDFFIQDVNTYNDIISYLKDS